MRTDTLVRLYLAENVNIAQGFPTGDVCKLADAVVDAYKYGDRIFVFGNGGGASIAEHFASDLKMHPFVSEDKHDSLGLERIKVLCLNESCGTITRVANDIGYDYIFTEQLKSHPLVEGDLVIAFSGSGNSPNILKALKYAKSEGARTALIGGRDGGKAGEIVDICILIPGTSNFPGQVGANDNCFHIEDFQSCIAHMITGILKGVVSG